MWRNFCKCCKQLLQSFNVRRSYHNCRVARFLWSRSFTPYPNPSSCRLVHSRVVHPCVFVPHCPLLRCPPLLFRAELSNPAFSTFAFLPVPRCPLPRFQSSRNYIYKVKDNPTHSSIGSTILRNIPFRTYSL